jgi:hypothetical protein
MKKMCYDGTEPGFICDDPEEKVVAVEVLNLLSYQTKYLQIDTIKNGCQCYNRDSVVSLITKLKDEILNKVQDGQNGRLWAADHRWATVRCYTLNKVLSAVYPERSKENLESRNMWPLPLAVKEYKEGKRNVIIPPRYLIGYIAGGKPNTYYAGMKDGYLARVTAPKIALWYVKRSEALDELHKIESETETFGRWMLVDMKCFLGASDRFLRGIFGADEDDCI